MWCVGVLNEQYRERMYDLLNLDARPFNCIEPVVCLDEKSTQLLAHSRVPVPMKPGVVLREDYEYIRRGTSTCSGRSSPKPASAPSQSPIIAARRTSWPSFSI